MKWQRGYRSRDVIDRRDEPGGIGMRPGLGALLPLAARFGWKGIVVLLVLMILTSGGVFSQLGSHGVGASRSPPAQQDEAASFVGFVLDDVQSTWAKIFERAGKDYQHAHLVLFTGETGTACGYGVAAVGPFYCPTDQNVYIDLDFYAQLRTRLGAPGDFAQAYVIAHEIGHHVQNQLGISDRIARASERERTGPNGLSVRLELQADCFAGVWAASTARRDLLEEGDIEEALRAAAAVGDDTLQRRTTGAVQPERWTHGSAAQRAHWFRRGYDAASPDACDTFGAATL